MYAPEPKRVWARVPRRVPAKVVPSYIGEPNLVGNWLFYNGSGDRLYDFSGEENHGDLYGPTWQDGPYGWSLDFLKANGEYVEGSMSETGTDFTFITWFWLRNTTQENSRIVTFNTGSDFAIYSIINQAGGGGYTMGFKDTGNGYNDMQNKGTLKSKTWVVLAGKYDGTTLTLIENDTVVDTLNVSATPKNRNQFNFGSQYTNINTLDGREAWVLYYDMHLSDSEVFDFYERTRGIFGV